MTRVLLSSVTQPFGPDHGDSFGVSYEGTHQILWAQGIFRPRADTTQWGIDFLAHNLRAPTVTLHYPTLENFIAEVKKGYDYVGIAFVATTAHKMRPMVDAVRRHAPNTKIILGGYGTTMNGGSLPEVDHICREEGVGFMRRILDEPQCSPITQPFITQDNQVFSVPLGRVGYVFAGLGCPNGCDFCVTSHYFKRKHIKLLDDGASILYTIEDMLARDPTINSFWINDEDFLLNRHRGREFLEAVRRSKLPPLSLSILSSMKALSHFEPSELVEMGVDWVWIGYEGQRAGYKKMAGRPYKEVFGDLRRHGISTLASMIVGFDYQTEEIIRAEFDDLMNIRPSMCQFLIYGPAYGTPLHKRMRDAGRLTSAADDPGKQDGFNLVFEHPHISAPNMSRIQRELFDDDFQRNGPSIYRVLDDWLNGYIHLRDHHSERVRAKAERYRKDAHQGMVLIPGALEFVNAGSRRWLQGLLDRLEAETGPMTRTERIASKAMPLLMHMEKFKQQQGIGQQPKFTRKTFM